MSKKHIEEQKLLIENFNKWVNEAKCGEEELDETADYHAEPETIDEDEQVDEGVLTAGVIATYLAGKTFINTIFSVLSLYNKLMQVNKKIQKDPNAPEQLKQDSQVATVELADIGNKLQALAAKLGWSPKAGTALSVLSDKQTQQLLASLYNMIPSDAEGEPDDQPEAPDDAPVVDADLMAKYAKLKNKSGK